jgi:hypothetical protein
MPAAGVTYIQTQERSYFRMKRKVSFESDMERVVENKRYIG